MDQHVSTFPQAYSTASKILNRVGSGAGGGHGPGGSPRGGVTAPKGGTRMFWNRISTDRKLELIQQDLELLKREFRQVQQEWDATAEHVAKTLPPIKRNEQSKLAAEEVEEHGDQTTLA